jgi:hypothetical protein
MIVQLTRLSRSSGRRSFGAFEDEAIFRGTIAPVGGEDHMSRSTFSIVAGAVFLVVAVVLLEVSIQAS